MRVRVSKDGSRIITLSLTKAEIERQALSDFQKYVSLYLNKYGNPIPDLLDVDFMVAELWGVSVVYRSTPLTADGGEVLGYFDQPKKEIVVDPQRCKYDARTTFTVAHEAGHISLHSVMLPFPPQLVRSRKKLDEKERQMEWQAHHYAASLLAPKQKVLELLKLRGLLNNNLISKVDLAIHAAPLQDHFGLSRYALEVRLAELGVPTINRKYD